MSRSAIRRIWAALGGSSILGPMVKDDKLERIVRARMGLRERFKERMERTPSLADGAPLGSGERNRHGMPVLPPDQTETTKWPVLDLGIKPKVSTEAWELTVGGLCDAPLSINWTQLLAFEQVDDTSDFHCVTAWSQMNIEWRGIRLADVIAAAEPRPEAGYILCVGYDDYTTNLPLEEAVKPDVLIAYQANGEPLPRDHGGPARIITPQLYAWKGTKWIRHIELAEHDRPGFWEERGYSMTAHPWRNDRYS